MQRRHFLQTAFWVSVSGSVLLAAGCGSGKGNRAILSVGSGSMGGGTVGRSYTLVLLGNANQSNLTSGFGGVGGGYIVSSVSPIVFRAATWNVSAPGTTIDLQPSGSTASQVYGVSDTLLVGSSTGASGASHATIWDRMAGNASADINGTWSASTAVASSGVLVVGSGQVTSGSATHAALWNGSTVTDLNGSFTSSAARAISGNRVVGVGINSGSSRAILWDHGAGNTVTDLSLVVGGVVSEANAIDGTQVAGFALENGARHAYVWDVSTGVASGIDLHPSGVSASEAMGLSSNLVVGKAVTSSSFEHAYLWDRTTGEAIDLHDTYLSGNGFQSSRAVAVDVQGNIYGSSGTVSDDFGSTSRAWILKKT